VCYGGVRPEANTQHPSKVTVFLVPAAAIVLSHRLPLHSQEPVRQFHPQFALQAPYVPPIPGEPFTAQYTIEMQKPTATGGAETWQSTTLVARDSKGRVRHELREFLPASSTQQPKMFCVVLSDPVARLSHTLDPVRRTDYRQWFHASHSHRFGQDNSAGEDLGARTVMGLDTTGERRTWSMRPRLGNSGPPAKVVDETWYSKALQLVVLEKQAGSSGIAVTIRLSHLDQQEPDPSLLTVPHGYRLFTGLTTSIPNNVPPWLDPSAGDPGGEGGSMPLVPDPGGQAPGR